MGKRSIYLGGRTAAVAASFVCVLMAASASATIVWQLNPNQLNGAVGSTSKTYTSQGYSITASGFNNNGGIGTPQDLFYKSLTPINGGAEIGLGVTNTGDHELQAGSSSSNPFDFIQFNLSMILKSGATSGSISVSSIQAGESFAIYGSNKLGTLGTQLGGTFGSTFDNKFVSLPNFGQYSYYSIVAASVDVLPLALSANIPPVPEMNAMLPVIALLSVVGAVELFRRRRVA
jgi:hypothetical protein